MGMLDGWRHDGRRTELAVEVEGMASFINAPPVILAAPHKVSRFPKVLAVIARPYLPGLAVHRQPPRIAQTISPDLRSRVCPTNKRVVPGHGVRARSVALSQ